MLSTNRNKGSFPKKGKVVTAIVLYNPVTTFIRWRLANVLFILFRRIVHRSKKLIERYPIKFADYGDSCEVRKIRPGFQIGNIYLRTCIQIQLGMAV